MARTAARKLIRPDKAAEPSPSSVPNWCGALQRCLFKG
jgi:hypothetical protein